MLNMIIEQGRIVKDAVLTTVPVGEEKTPTPCCRFSIAVNDTTSNGKEYTEYFDITLWRNYAIQMAPWLLHSREVIVIGKFRKNQYAKDGAVRTSLQIHNATVYFTGKKPDIGFEEPDDVPFE